MKILLRKIKGELKNHAYFLFPVLTVLISWVEQLAYLAGVKQVIFK